MFNLFRNLELSVLLKMVGLTVICLALYLLSTLYFTPDNVKSTFFLGMGIALASVLGGGNRYLLSVFFTAVIAIAWIEQSLPLAIGFAISWLAGIMWATRSLTKINNFAYTLHSHADYFHLIVFAGILASGLTALLQTGLLYFYGAVTVELFVTNLLFCWLGNSFGIMLITPLLLSWNNFPEVITTGTKRIIETLSIVAVALLVGDFVFLTNLDDNLYADIKGYWLFPLIIWAALRMGLPMMTLMLAVLAMQGAYGIYAGVGYFVGQDDLRQQLLHYWFYLMTLTLLGQGLSVYFAERKLVESALLDSQNHFRTLVNNTSILVWISGINKRCYYFNQVWLEFTGRTLAQEIGDGWLDGIHRDDIRHYLDTYMSAFDVREAFTIEYRLASADGAYHWMLDHGAPRFDEQGNFLGFIGTLVDISSRKTAEKALGLRTRELALQNIILKQISSGISLAKLLTELARQIEALLPNSLCSILLLDEEGEHLLHGASPSLPAVYREKLHGISLVDGVAGFADSAIRGERIIVKNIHEHPDWLQFRSLATRVGVQSCWSEPIIKKDSHILGIFIIYHRQPKQPSSGECALIERYANLAALTIDHKQSENALQESEERLRLVLEGGELGFWDWQVKQNVVQRNAIWAEILGYNHADIKNTIQQWLDLVYTEDKQRALQSIKDVVNGKSDIHEIEYRMVHKNGSLKWIHDHAKVVQRDSDGLPARISGIHADLTKIKQAEEELRIAAIAFESQEGMFVTDKHSVILRINQAFSKITGYTEQDTLGRTPRFFQSGIQNAGFYQAIWEQLNSTGEWQGEIWNKRKKGDVYPAWLTITAVKGSNGKVSHYVATLTDITARKLAEEKIAKLAFYDSLTHLPNRRLLMEHLDHCIAVSKRDGKRIALLMLDLDRFKAVNDNLGHQAGDELLQQVAKRLSMRLRDADMVARLGGDEFIVLLSDIKSREDAGQVAENIVEDLSLPFRLLQGNEVRIGVSIGISICPQHSDTPESLMEQADIALYQAKNKGRGQYSYFSGVLANAAHDRAVIEKRLSRAIEQQELKLVYQAQVELATNTIIGAEVFVRWKNSIDGLTPLHRFMSIAEESGLILNIGEWVLKEACRQGRIWLDSGLKPLSIAVNISPLQFRQVELNAMVAGILAETGFPADYLMLEVTESGLMQNQEYAVDVLGEFHQQGIRLAIDDFGTGYTSLAYIKRFPLDILKIDKRFIDAISNQDDDLDIAATIITMGHLLGFKILAEGVETQEQLNFLRDKGCDIYQGYIKSRPLSADAFAELVRTETNSNLLGLKLS